MEWDTLKRSHSFTFACCNGGSVRLLYIPAGLSLIADWHQGKVTFASRGYSYDGRFIPVRLSGGFRGHRVCRLFLACPLFMASRCGIIYAVVLILFLRRTKGQARQEQVCREGVRLYLPRLSSKEYRCYSANIAFWVILFYFAVPSLPSWATKSGFRPCSLTVWICLPCRSRSVVHDHNSALLFSQ